MVPSSSASVVTRATNAGTNPFRNTLEFVADTRKHRRIGEEETNDGERAIPFHATLLAAFSEGDCALHA